MNATVEASVAEARAVVENGASIATSKLLGSMKDAMPSMAKLGILSWSDANQVRSRSSTASTASEGE